MVRQVPDGGEKPFKFKFKFKQTGDPTPIIQSQPSKNEALRALLTDQQSKGVRDMVLRLVQKKMDRQTNRQNGSAWIFDF